MIGKIGVSFLSLALPAIAFSQGFDESQLQKVSKEIETLQSETRVRLAASRSDLSLATQPTADFEAALAGLVGTIVYGPGCLGSCDHSFTTSKEDLAQIKKPNSMVTIPSENGGPARLAWEVDVYVGGGGRKSMHRFYSLKGQEDKLVPDGSHFKFYIDPYTGALISAVARWRS